MIANTGADVLEPSLNLTSRRNGSALECGGRAKRIFGFHVAVHDPSDGAFPLGVRGSENFIKHVQINAEPLDVVFDGGQSEIDEVNLFPLNEDVVAG